MYIESHQSLGLTVPTEVERSCAMFDTSTMGMRLLCSFASYGVCANW